MGCLMPATPTTISTHFPGSFDIEKSPAVQKREDQDKCVNAINARIETGLPMCMEKVQNFENRENCDTSEIRSKNPTMSHCTACKEVVVVLILGLKLKTGKLFRCVSMSVMHL